MRSFHSSSYLRTCLRNVSVSYMTYLLPPWSCSFGEDMCLHKLSGTKLWAVEMQEHLHHKHEDLSKNPQNSWKKKKKAWWNHAHVSPSMGGSSRDRRIPETHHLSSSWFSERFELKVIRHIVVENTQLLFWLLHFWMNTHIHMHVRIQELKKARSLHFRLHASFSIPSL